MVNLVGNAVRHSPEQSTIWIRLDEVDGRARVIVADQGGGVDPADHERISIASSGSGQSGRGWQRPWPLHLPQACARMAGDVAVESALGRGARFILDLPAWTASRNGSQAR